jgi:hypothetical protein
MLEQVPRTLEQFSRNLLRMFFEFANLLRVLSKNYSGDPAVTPSDPMQVDKTKLVEEQEQGKPPPTLKQELSPPRDLPERNARNSAQHDRPASVDERPPSRADTHPDSTSDGEQSEQRPQKRPGNLHNVSRTPSTSSQRSDTRSIDSDARSDSSVATYRSRLRHH